MARFARIDSQIRANRPISRITWGFPNWTFFCKSRFGALKFTRENPLEKIHPKWRKVRWKSFSEEFPLGSWLVSQGRRQMFARAFRKSSCKHCVFLVYFGIWRWVFGPLPVQKRMNNPLPKQALPALQYVTGVFRLALSYWKGGSIMGLLQGPKMARTWISMNYITAHEGALEMLQWNFFNPRALPYNLEQVAGVLQEGHTSLEIFPLESFKALFLGENLKMLKKNLKI